MSWISSLTNPDGERIRFEGDEHAEAWPEGHTVTIKRHPDGRDLILMQRASESPRLKTEQDLNFVSAIGTCAAMVVKVEGDEFTDPDTGKALDFSGDPTTEDGLDSRVLSATRLPLPVLMFVTGEISERVASPLVRKPEPSTSASKPRSITRSR